METTMSARWRMPAVGLLIGGLLFGGIGHGRPAGPRARPVRGHGTYSGVLGSFGGWSEMIGVLGGRPADERLVSFDILATAVAGTVATIVAIVGFLWAIAHGQSGNDFAVVVAAAGIAYLIAILWFRWRA